MGGQRELRDRRQAVARTSLPHKESRAALSAAIRVAEVTSFSPSAVASTSLSSLTFALFLSKH